MTKLVLALLLVLGAVPVQASQLAVFGRDGKKLPDSDVNSSAVNWELLSIAGHAQYNGIGLVDIFGGGGCTGTFLNTGAATDGPAYVLSNGHCVGGDMPTPKQVIVDQPADSGMNFRFNYFVDGGSATHSVSIKRVLYSTMHGTDITLFELDATYGELVAAGYTAYRIANQDPALGTAVEMLGVPQTGVKREKRFLRRSTCEIFGRANVHEGGYEWFGSFKHRCSSVGGSSGSPMISLATHEIVAINNTGVDDDAVSQPECALDRPCEVAPDGKITTDYVSNYSQRVSDIPSCIGADGRFDLSLPGCKLERPSAQ